MSRSFHRIITRQDLEPATALLCSPSGCSFCSKKIVSSNRPRKILANCSKLLTSVGLNGSRARRRPRFALLSFAGGGLCSRCAFNFRNTMRGPGWAATNQIRFRAIFTSHSPSHGRSGYHRRQYRPFLRHRGRWVSLNSHCVKGWSYRRPSFFRRN